LRDVCFAVLFETVLGRTHGDDVVESVAALNAHVVGDGTESVGGVEIAVALGVEGAAPEAFALVGEELFAEVVEVCAFSVKKVAKRPSCTILRMSVSLYP